MAKYWFRKRRGLLTKDLGWCWIPISWEGWFVMLFFLAIIILSALVLVVFNGTPSYTAVAAFVIILAASLGCGALISWKKSKPA